MAMDRCFGMMEIIIKVNGVKAISKDRVHSILKKADCRKVASNKISSFNSMILFKNSKICQLKRGRRKTQIRQTE